MSLIKRDAYRNAIKRCLGASKKAESYDEADIDSFFVLLSAHWTNFLQEQDAVELSCGAETLQEQEAERDQGEEWYRQAFANLTRASKKFKTGTSSKSSITRADVKLPRMDLPRFAGDPKDWRPFSDAFKSFIHNESSLSGSQKLHYLRCSLQGEALQVIKGFPITDDNYVEAWKLLEKRFNVQRIIIDSHFQALFALKQVTTESAIALKSLIDATQEHFQSLKALGRPVTNWDDWLVHLTISKLDAETHRQWELSQKKDTVPTFDMLISFVESRCRSLDAIDSHLKSSPSALKLQSSHQLRSKTRHATGSLHTSTPTEQTNTCTATKSQQYTCAFCSGKHKIYSCDKFRSLESARRSSFVREKNLCSNCLGVGHSSDKCRSSNACRTCQVRHHTLLHPHRETSTNPAATSVTSLSPGHSSHNEYVVLLGTASVKVRDQCARYQPARLLFDNGSHLTFISECCAQRLKLKRTPSSTAIEGIGATAAGNSKGEVELTISPTDTASTTTIRAQVIPKITNNLPPVQLRKIDWSHISGLKLADPSYHTPGAIDILIGSDELGQFLCTGLIRGPAGSPIAQQTTLGWVLFGKVVDCEFPCNTYTNTATCMLTDVPLTKAVSKFWHVESLPETKHLSFEERLCEKFFDDTHYRNSDGRYVVKLPFKSNCDLGNSRDAAVRSLLRMEKQFARDKELHAQYTTFIHEFIDLGHMEEGAKPPVPNHHYFMPHRAVIKNTSSTTKLRVVFNASHRTTSGYSLNDTQMIGPQLQADLYSTLLRLRSHRYAMSADVAKMYRQVRIDDEHIDYQRIVWRDSPLDDIKEYRLLTVTYGVASASHLAVKSLQQTALDEGQDHPTARNVILNDFYMDDLLTGCCEEAELQHLRVQISSILSRGGFHLRKWASNSSLVISGIPKNERETTHRLDFSAEDSVRTLGLQWEPFSDTLTFAVQVHEIDIANLTKRLLLSETSKLFDPLGLLSPCTVIPKMLFQRLWSPKVDWDEAVPDDIKRQWLHYRNHITYLAAIKLPRWVGVGIPNSISDIHGFADASQTAYAAVVYIRTVTHLGHISTHLLTAKTRVAPLKQTTITLPRLELCGAALLAQLISHVKSSLNYPIRNIFGWSDSNVTLAWIRQHPGKWATFVANRVSQIQSVIPPENWSHVQSSLNPADCATRGVLPQNLAEHPLWWNGPPWLKQAENSWPVQQLFVTNLDLRSESSNITNSTTATPVWEMINRFSSLSKLKHVTAYILRFRRNLRSSIANHGIPQQTPSRVRHHLHPSELHEALCFWVKQTQYHYFSGEIQRLLANKHVSRHSRLLKLYPFLDDEGLLRVGGRLSNSALQPDRKHPLLLPGNARLTTLICEDVHRLSLHAGPQTMQTMLQHRFWVLGARKILRKIYRSCVKCRRYSNVLQQQLMGDLPRPRVEACRPFMRSGVDFAGPVQLRLSRGRGSKSVKGYVSVFICMSTGAMHLELASDLSSSTFISVFKRFVSRRGHCKELFSDNGTNFTGAEKELRVLLQSAIKDENLAKYLADDGTIWHFNPPGSPHMGGYWEAAVKRLKYHLRRTVGEILLTYEEFTTLLTEIEACANSRPLCSMSTDVNDLTALTPGHFLVGEPLKLIPEPNSNDFRTTLSNRWHLISNMRQHFWKRWNTEYLVQLQQRSRWTRRNSNTKVGDLVVIRDERTPPAKWKLARVTEVHPGADGNVRVVTLKTADGSLTRSIVKISPLLSLQEETI